MNELLQGYPVTIEIPVAWGEMDAYQHVNNIVYFRYFESARIAYFEKIDFVTHQEQTGVGPILAATQCRFKFPLTYPDRVTVGSRVTSIEEDRFIMEYVVASQRHQRVAAEGQGLVVSYDYSAKCKAPLPAVIKERIRELEKLRGAELG